MAFRTTQDLRISIENGLVTISTGTGQAQVPADQIDYIVNALKAAQMLVGIAPSAPAAFTFPASADAAPAVEAAPAPVRAKRAAPAPAPAPVAVVAPVAKVATEPAAPPAAPKRRGRPPKNVGPDGQSLTKRRSRKRVGDALEAWLRQNPGWYTEDELLDLVKREKMSDADPNRALKIALGKQKDSLFVTDDSGRWSLAGTPATAAKGMKAAKEKAPKAQPAAPAKATKAAATKEAKPAPAARGTRKRQTAATGGKKNTDQESSPASERKGAAKADAASEAPAGKPVRVKKGESRDDVLQAGRKPSANARPSATWPTTQQDRERIRRNLFGE